MKSIFYKSIRAGIMIMAFALFACNTQKKNLKNDSQTINEELKNHETAAELTFYDWNTGYLKAKRLNKILLVDVYTDWCYYCKVMDKNTYSDKTVIDSLNKNFVCVKFNPEIKNDSLVFDATVVNNKALLTFLFDNRSNGFPTTTFWINPSKSEKLEVVPGYMEPKAFIGLLNEIVTKKKAS